MADKDRQGGNRDRFRDNDDVREPESNENRNEPRPDPRDEARGDARENVGRHARNTDTDPTGPENNDRTKRDRPDLDEFQRDLER